MIFFLFFATLNSLKIYHHNLPLRKLMHTFFHISLSGSSSSTLALASSAIESCNYNVHQHIRPIQNEKVKIKRCTWDDITYHNEIALKKSVNQMEENVFGVFRMTLDAHHVVPILEHFDPSPIRPCYHLCFGWELPDLHYYNSPHHIRTQAFMLVMIVWIQVLPGLRKGTLTSSRWHSITGSTAGILRDEKSFDDDDRWTVVTPMSHPLRDRPILAPNERPSTWSKSPISSKIHIISLFACWFISLIMIYENKKKK